MPTCPSHRPSPPDRRARWARSTGQQAWQRSAPPLGQPRAEAWTWPPPSLSRWAVPYGRPPALDVDLSLAGDRVTRLAAARRLRSGRNSHAPPDTYAVRIVLAFLHEAGDLDHRTFVRFDFRHHFLRSVDPQMLAFWNVDAARLICRAAAGSEDIALRTSGNGHADGVFRHGLFFLCHQRTGEYGDNDGDNGDFHEKTPNMMTVTVRGLGAQITPAPAFAHKVDLVDYQAAPMCARARIVRPVAMYTAGRFSKLPDPFWRPHDRILSSLAYAEGSR